MCLIAMKNNPSAYNLKTEIGDSWTPGVPLTISGYWELPVGPLLIFTASDSQNKSFSANQTEPKIVETDQLNCSSILSSLIPPAQNGIVIIWQPQPMSFNKLKLSSY